MKALSLTIVLVRDSNSVTQSLSSKSIWRRGWNCISLPIHRVTVSLFTLSLSLFLSLGSFLLFDEARWRSVVEFSPSINAANPRLIRDRSWNRPTSSFHPRDLLPIFQEFDNTSRFFENSLLES